LAQAPDEGGAIAKENTPRQSASDRGESRSRNPLKRSPDPCPLMSNGSIPLRWK
jgi:hypothetical protein